MTPPTDPRTGRRTGRQTWLTPLLSRWLDGRATPREAASVERLLAADPEAAACVRRLREAGDVLRASARRDAAPDLADRVLAEGAFHAPEGGEVAAFRRVARRYVAAAVALLALGLGGSVWIETTSAAASASGLQADPADARIEEMVLSDLDGAPAEGPDPTRPDR